MIEIILLIGLLYILGLSIFLHVFTTSTNPSIREATGVSADSGFHHWFIPIEVILILTIVYVITHIS